MLGDLKRFRKLSGLTFAAIILLPLLLQPAVAYGANADSPSPLRKITHSVYCTFASLFNPSACNPSEEQFPPSAIDEPELLAARINNSLPYRSTDTELLEPNVQPVPQIIQPVVERTLHTREIIRESGITQDQFDIALNNLRRQISSAQAALPASYGAPVARSIPNTWGLTQRIDQLSGVDFSGGTITGTPITNSSISGSTGSFTDFFATNATTTNFFATSLTALSGFFTDLISLNATFTNATTTDFVATGATTLNTLTTSGNTSIAGTLGVTGTTTLASTTLVGPLYDASSSAGAVGELITSTGTSTAWGTIGGSSITTNSLDWSEFTNAMALDANSTIDMDTNSADLNFDSNTLVIDSSTNRVGIGTAAPGSALDITGSSDQVQLSVKGNSTQTNYLILAEDSSGADRLRLTNLGQLILTAGASTSGLVISDTQLYRDSTDTLRTPDTLIVDSNIGIGDTSPAAALTVGSGDLFQVNSSGAITAATGITSSGTINFSGLTASRLVATNASKNLTNAITEANLENSVSDVSNIFTNNDIITSANIADSYLLNTGDAATGDYNFDSNTFVINSGNNRVGIGEASPTAKLDINSGTSNMGLYLTSTDNDVHLKMSDDDTAGFISVRNNVLSLGSGQLDLTNNLTIEIDTGDVGIGDATPSDKLDVAGDIRVGTGTTGCVKDADGTSIAGTCSSDERLKTDIADMPDILDSLVELRPVSYHWNETAADLFSYGTSSEQIGLIAQDVELHLPALVTEDAAGYKQIRFSDLPIYLLKGMREMWTIVSGNRSDIVFLKNEVAALKVQLAASSNFEPGANNDNSPAPEPTIQLRGNDPANVALGVVYSDLGVIAKDANGNDISVSLLLDGEPVDAISLDTSTSTTHIITYSAEGSQGTAMEITRTVNIGEQEETEAEDANTAEPEAAEAEEATDEPEITDDTSDAGEENADTQDTDQENVQHPEETGDEPMSSISENEPVHTASDEL